MVWSSLEVVRGTAQWVSGAGLGVHWAGDVVPNPAPADPTSGTTGVSLLISYVKWGVIVFLGLCAVGSAGMLGAGSFANRPDAAERGKRGLLWSLVGVIVAAIAIPVVNNIFSAAT